MIEISVYYDTITCDGRPLEICPHYFVLEVNERGNVYNYDSEISYLLSISEKEYRKRLRENVLFDCDDSENTFYETDTEFYLSEKPGETYIERFKEEFEKELVTLAICGER